MPGHSVPLAGLGGFILIFGFLAFNGGSQVGHGTAAPAHLSDRSPDLHPDPAPDHLSESSPDLDSAPAPVQEAACPTSDPQTTITKPGDGGVVALAIVNTILGASTGGVSVLFIVKVFYSSYY